MQDTGCQQLRSLLLLTCNLDARPVQQLDAALGRARHKQRVAAPHGQAADVDGVEAVAVLLMTDGVQDALLVDVLGQGQLRGREGQRAPQQYRRNISRRTAGCFKMLPAQAAGLCGASGRRSAVPCAGKGAAGCANCSSIWPCASSMCTALPAGRCYLLLHTPPRSHCSAHSRPRSSSERYRRPAVGSAAGWLP